LLEGKVVNEIKVDDHTRQWATVALQRMLDITRASTTIMQPQITAD
jgi:quinolinate synthase